MGESYFVEVCKNILAADRAIRVVAIGGEDGGILGLKVREDLATTILPRYNEILEKFGETWARVIWGIVDEIGKYMGKAGRIIVYHERANWVTLKANGKIVAFSVEKEASPEILATKVEEIVKRSFKSEKAV